MFAPRSLETLIASAIAFVLGITIHEFAHAWMAYRLGDDLPYRQGRVTLNPLAHLDPLGTLLIFVAGFGWGRPVQVSPWALGSERNHALVALAGPVSNILVATLAAIPFQLGFVQVNTNTIAGMPSLGFILFFIVGVNVLLAVFNMIPLTPLDGSKVFVGLLPPPLADPLRRIQPHGPMILMALILVPFVIPGLNPLGWIIGPPIGALVGLLVG